jgi:hypothetical protein
MNKNKLIYPTKYPNRAKGAICLRYHINEIFSIPIATTPAADPMIKIEPPVPAV